jgi:hypothetical protein
MAGNKRDGKGIYVHSGVGRYDGTFSNDIKVDAGLEIMFKKWAYQGNFVNGLRH